MKQDIRIKRVIGIDRPHAHPEGLESEILEY